MGWDIRKYNYIDVLLLHSFFLFSDFSLLTSSVVVYAECGDSVCDVGLEGEDLEDCFRRRGDNNSRPGHRW